MEGSTRFSRAALAGEGEVGALAASWVSAAAAALPPSSRCSSLLEPSVEKASTERRGACWARGGAAEVVLAVLAAREMCDGETPKEPVSVFLCREAAGRGFPGAEL